MSYLLETMAEYDRRRAREKFLRKLRGAAWWIATHSIAFAIGAGVVYATAQAVEIHPIVMRDVKPATSISIYRCSKVEAIAMATAFKNHELALHELANYAEMCKVRKRMEQVGPKSDNREGDKQP